MLRPLQLADERRLATMMRMELPKNQT